MLKLFLVRHGETTYNAEGRIQGHKDAPLSALGLRQADVIAERLAAEKIDAIYSSDLGRASATAEIVALRHGLGVQATPLLRESKLGIAEGLTRAELEERYPNEFRDWRGTHAVRLPGSETMDQVIDRCREFVQQVGKAHGDGEQIVVVGHGGSARGVIIAALGLPTSAYSRLHFSNASLSIIDAGDRPGLWLMNDTCHLDSLRTSEEEVDNVAH